MTSGKEIVALLICKKIADIITLEGFILILVLNTSFLLHSHSMSLMHKHFLQEFFIFTFSRKNLQLTHGNVS